jgi:hypothetical protein
MGRPPKFEKAMTARERKQHQRARKPINGVMIHQCLVKAGSNLSLTPPSIEDCEIWSPFIESLIEVLKGHKGDKLSIEARRYGRLFINEVKKSARHLIMLAAVFESAGPSTISNYHLIEEAGDMMGAVESVRLLLDLHPNTKSRAFDWRFLAWALVCCAKYAWREENRLPDSLHEDAPLCLFAVEVLGLLGIIRAPSTVSVALYEKAAIVAEAERDRESVTKHFSRRFPEG